MLYCENVGHATIRKSGEMAHQTSHKMGLEHSTLHFGGTRQHDHNTNVSQHVHNILAI